MPEMQRSMAQAGLYPDLTQLTSCGHDFRAGFEIGHYHGHLVPAPPQGAGDERGLGFGAAVRGGVVTTIEGNDTQGNDTDFHDFQSLPVAAAASRAGATPFRCAAAWHLRRF